ncbi:MAG: hypothetical protein K0R18_75 [Bacillales bacterium]|nr:hypothetical protein [Bacillales bacterium]
MEARKGSFRVLGSCNFCNRGKLSACGYDLIYPYTEVYQIEGDRMSVRMCEDCLETIKDMDALVDATKVMRELVRS